MISLRSTLQLNTLPTAPWQYVWMTGNTSEFSGLINQMSPSHFFTVVQFLRRLVGRWFWVKSSVFCRFNPNNRFAQSAGAVEYKDCFSIACRSPSKCHGHDSKQSDDEVTVMLELWGIRSYPSLPSLPGSLWPGVVASERILSFGQIELNYVLMLKWIVWNRTIFYFLKGY